MKQAIGTSTVRAKTAMHRLTNTLMKARQGGVRLKDVKNEGRPGYVYENKGMSDKLSDNISDVSAWSEGILQKRAALDRHSRAKVSLLTLLRAAGNGFARGKR
jgi:hypothetical protein